MLIVKGEKCGTIFCATGALGFYGEGYPFHSLPPWAKASKLLRQMGFSGKTMTLEPRRGKKYGEAGNMPLKEDGVTPEEFLPRCIYTNFITGEMINAVGLTNWSLEFYLQLGQFKKRKDPYFISVMLMSATAAEREAELREICRLLKKYLPPGTLVILQINFGCPNSGHDLHEFYDEICRLVELAKSLVDIPVFTNTNALMPTKVLVEVGRIADGLWIGNTIPFGDPTVGGHFHWERFGKESPLRRRGINADGGLSGPACLPLTIDKVHQLRDSGVHVPIVGGNGIRTTQDVTDLKRAGCNAVFVGSVVVVRPHRVEAIKSHAERIFA